VIILELTQVTSQFIACDNEYNVDSHDNNAKWARRVARVGEMRNAYTILVGRDHLGDLGVGGE
jgi:hypothetical protein